ncbi:ABC transporter ATP-binding protein [Bacillus sp. JCM 19046]|nr:ABC transporter ATP-binding protein [Bacillus sp. JCM 19046]
MNERSRLWANKGDEEKTDFIRCSFAFRRRIRLIGPNGAGKTTLMKILAGLESFQKGQVSLNNKVIEKSAYIRRYDLIGYLSQDFMVFPELTIYEVLEHIAHLHGAVPLQIPASIKTVLEEVNLSHHAQKKMRELSGGMRRSRYSAASVKKASNSII